MAEQPTAKKRAYRRRPVAWVHTMHYERGCGSQKMLTFNRASPFGVPGIDHSKEYKVTSEPLYRG